MELAVVLTLSALNTAATVVVLVKVVSLKKLLSGEESEESSESVGRSRKLPLDRKGKSRVSKASVHPRTTSRKKV